MNLGTDGSSRLQAAMKTDAGAAILALLGDRLLVHGPALTDYRGDTWVLSMLRERQGRGASGPGAVALPETTDEVAAVVAFCRAHEIPVVPRGGGSGVVGGVGPSPDAMVVSTENLVGDPVLSETDHTVSFGAGTNGMTAEQWLQEQGFTLGHWPQSITLSTVGGWVATRASGQLSTAYGNIEDLVVALTAVLPDGSVLHTRDTPRAAAGPDLRQILLGSEGTLGIITEVALRVRRLPAARRPMFVHFPSMADGLDAVRTMVQCGITPPVVRLYDAVESQRNFSAFAPAERAALILVFEDSVERIDLDQAETESILASHHGTVGDPQAAADWFANKSHAPSAVSFLEKDIVVDTIEVAAPWSRIQAVYAGVIEAVGALDHVLAVSGHSSHSYVTGTNIYFSFGVRCPDPADLEVAYNAVWNATMRATLDAGGGISHHHGIGRVRRSWMTAELGEGGIAVLRSLKASLDPCGLFNPDVLLP